MRLAPSRPTRTRALGTVTALGLAAAVLAAPPSATAAPAVHDVTPLRTVTGVASPQGVAVSAAGETYVTTAGFAYAVFAKGAQGEATPIRRVTGFPSGPFGIALDGSTRAYVSTFASGARVFAAGADGGAVPVRTLALKGEGVGIAVSPDGTAYVGDREHTIERFAPGDEIVDGTLTMAGGSGLRGLEVDRTGRLWAAAAAAREVRMVQDPAGAGTVTRRIAGARTGLQQPTDVALDAAGRVYVSDYTGHDVKVFAPGAYGDVAPIAVLRGPRTGIEFPVSVAVGAGGEVVVASYVRGTVSTFGPLSLPAPPKPKPTVKVPGKPRALKVSGKRAAKSRKVSWKAPSSNGGARITGYRLVVKKGGKTLLRRDLGATRRSYTLKRAKLRNGKLTVFVRAKNAKGYGPSAKKAFRVRK
ncbi:fibronectin type III domain-containing protein [Mumia quercus]|uniref:fibronectin type III domain-containing protein n=1 Tax=Mumia quercus TaxID=2976125 RepID=UPI0021D2B256|nr:hypothetical protein [Mumia quercus]